jgi:hypothetical protein
MKRRSVNRYTGPPVFDHCNRLDRAVGVSALRAFSEGYHDTAEATQPTAPQSTAHTPNDRNNTAVIDTRSNQ